MPDFLVHSYVADPGHVISAVGLAQRSDSPRLMRAILIPDDEIVLTLWRGADRDAVCQATSAMGLALDRISTAEDLLGQDTEDAQD